MSITYDRRKEYFKHYYKTHKAEFLRRNQLNRLRASAEEAKLKAETSLRHAQELAAMEQKMLERLKKA